MCAPEITQPPDTIDWIASPRRSGSQHDFGRNVIPAMIDNYQVYAFPFRDQETGEQAYWRDVGTLDAFWEANMELISVTPQLNIYDQVWPCTPSSVRTCAPSF